MDRWALARIQRLVRSAPIRFRLWDGFELAPEGRFAVATIVFKGRRALFGWVFNPELNFGEAYMSGEVEIRGDLPRIGGHAQGPGGPVLQQRLEQARELLRNPEISLSEISLRTGFADQSHFTNVFRRFAGITPARFRALL